MILDWGDWELNNRHSAIFGCVEDKMILVGDKGVVIHVVVWVPCRAADVTLPPMSLGSRVLRSFSSVIFRGKIHEKSPLVKRFCHLKLCRKEGIFVTFSQFGF